MLKFAALKGQFVCRDIFLQKKLKEDGPIEKPYKGENYSKRMVFK